MNENRITIRMNDWQFNSSIVGFIRVVGEENVEVNNASISFGVDVLEGFSTKYFDYFIETYKETLSWYKIIRYKEEIEKYEREDFENFDEDALDRLNVYIKSVLKVYLKSASYKAAYALIDNELDMLEEEKKLKTITIPKAKNFEEVKNDLISEVESNFKIINRIIAYCESEQGRKYLAGKNVIYTIIKNGWDGVSILNPQTKEKDMYIDFQNHFVQPVIDDFELDKSKYKYTCCLCEAPIKNLEDGLTFLNETGFDAKRKNSHAWDFVNDLAICPACKLIYACLPAGMIYVYNQGLFVNANSSMKELVRSNEQVKLEVLDLNRHSLREVNTYAGLVNAFKQQDSQMYQLQLDDIQIVRYQNETYRFNILSKKILDILEKAEIPLKSIEKSWLVEGKDNYSLYQLVLERLFNNENMFTLIHKLLVYKATKVNNPGYSDRQIKSIIQINQEFLGGIEAMEKLPQDDVNKINSTGWYFKQQYDNPNKVEGIAYKLLNALKISNRDEFMNVLLNCYAYLNQPVPKIFNQVFQDEETFKTIGYSFVAGIIGPVKSDNGGK